MELNVMTKKKEGSPALNRIGEILKERKLSTHWLMKHTDYSYPTVSGWVRNNSQPNLDQLSDIAKVLDLTIGDLLTKSVR